MHIYACMCIYTYIYPSPKFPTDEHFTTFVSEVRGGRWKRKRGGGRREMGEQWREEKGGRRREGKGEGTRGKEKEE